MLVMALEAIQQIAARSQDIVGFHIKEAHFLSPVIVEEIAKGGTETTLHLRPLQRSHDEESTWFEIIIFSCQRDVWDECFRAIIEAQLKNNTTEVDGGRERQLENERILWNYNQSTKTNASAIEPGAFYAFLQGTGVKYGKSFQLLQNMRWNGSGYSTADIDIPESIGSNIVHPAILDAALHLTFLEVSKGLSESSSTLVPYKLFNTWISAKGWDHIQSSSLRVSSSAKRGANTIGWDATIYVLADDDSPLCSIEQLAFAPMSQNDASERVFRRLLHNIEWKPQLSSLGPQELKEFCNITTSGRPVVDESALGVFYRDNEYAMITVAHRVLQDLAWPEDLSGVPNHLQRLVSSIRHFYELHFGSSGTEEMNEECINATWEKCKTFKPQWKIFSVVARNLKAILREEVDPLHIVFSSGEAETFYSSIFSDLCGERFRIFVDLLSHENPSLRILEVGAGTGGMTQCVLSALQELEEQSGTSRFAEYMYTDISPAFFEKAREKFHHFEGRMGFKKFDMQRSVQENGLDLGEGYDVVIAGSVLHVATDLIVALHNIRQILKPGGYLINVESITPESACANIAFGTLPGWWQAGEEWRIRSPLLTESQWDQALKETGFSGNILTLRDSETDACHTFSLMISASKQLSQAETPRQQLVLVLDESSEAQSSLAAIICQKYSASTLSLDCLENNTIAAEAIIISILDIGSPFLANISEGQFRATQNLMKIAKNLLWVTSTSLEDEAYPYYQATTGFMRALRTESFERRFVTLAVEWATLQVPEKTVDYIIKVLRIFSEDNSLSSELEFIVRHSCLNIGRLVEETSLNESLQALAVPQLRKEPLSLVPALTLSVRVPGLPDTLQFVEDPIYSMQLSLDEVEIEAKAWALSFRDVFIALGRLPGEFMGFECSGTVTRLGASAKSTSKLQPGDRVVLCSPGCMRTYPRTNAQNVFRIPDTISFEDSISSLNPGITAYHALVNVARLQKGESVLIHSASGGTGQIAIWIAKIFGAKIFVTVGFDQKKQLLMDTFGIPSDRIFHSRRPFSFAKGIMRATGGRGVDVVLNSLSGAGLKESWECVAPYGRFVELGKADIMANSSLPMSSFAKNVSFSAVDIYHISQSNPTLIQSLVMSVRDLLAQGAIHNPTPQHIYSTSNIEEAFRFMQSGMNTGRIIIRVDRHDNVPVRFMVTYLLSLKKII